jgi:hypothetical protein
MQDDLFNTSTITLDTLMGSIDLTATYITNGTGSLIAPYSSPYITISDNSSDTFKVNGDASFDGDIKIKGISLNETLKAIQDRLSILVPDPAKLEQFEALKKAYEHYKLLESLCDPNFKKEE